MEGCGHGLRVWGQHASFKMTAYRTWLSEPGVPAHIPHAATPPDGLGITELKRQQLGSDNLKPNEWKAKLHQFYRNSSVTSCILYIKKKSYSNNTGPNIMQIMTLMLFLESHITQLIGVHKHW